MQDVFICDYIRTPIGRYGGALSSVRADDLAALPLKALMSRHPDLDWAATVDVIYAAPIKRGKTTVAWRGWRSCWQACRRRSREQRSTVCADPVWMRF